MKKNNSDETNNEFTSFLSDLSAVKLEAISSIILTLGYSISTLAALAAVNEEEEKKSSKSTDNNKELKQLYKQLQNLNNRLDSIEKKLNRF